MNIVGVTACTVGIAHTYIAQKKIETAAKKAGHNVKIETQGTIGSENPLTADEIAAADIVLLARARQLYVQSILIALLLLLPLTQLVPHARLAQNR